MVVKHKSSKISEMDSLKQKNQTVLDSYVNGYSAYHTIFAYIKNRLICAIATNILNLKSFLPSLSSTFSPPQLALPSILLSPTSL